jgi:general secretion pathway protein G
MKTTGNKSGKHAGFTLVELMVVLAVIALLVSIVAPRAIGGVTRAEEAVLKQDLALMRDALDKHYSDAGRYPGNLQELVTKRYLRSLPNDPLTKSSATWIVVAPSDPEKGAVYDVRSGAPGAGKDGTPYAQW